MPTFSHFAIQAKHALVRDTMLEEAQNPAVAHGIKKALDVRVEHPAHLSPVDPGVQRVQRIMLATSGPESIGEAQEVCLVDCLQDEHDCLLDDLVLQAEDAQWPL